MAQAISYNNTQQQEMITGSQVKAPVVRAADTKQSETKL